MLVDTQGYDYARYMSYAPKIAMPVEYLIRQDMRKSANMENFYVPLQIVERGVEFGERYDIDGTIYFDKIRDTVRRDDKCDEKRGLAGIYPRKHLSEKGVYQT